MIEKISTNLTSKSGHHHRLRKLRRILWLHCYYFKTSRSTRLINLPILGGIWSTTPKRKNMHSAHVYILIFTLRIRWSPHSPVGIVASITDKSFRLKRRKRNTNGVEPACETRNLYISPKVALNDKNQWKFIVNAQDRDPRIKQIVRAELCR